MICHFLFFNRWFNFQDSVCNGCHDLMMLSLNISDIAIIAVKGVDYHCISHSINKSEVIHLLEYFVFDDHEDIYKMHA